MKTSIRTWRPTVWQDFIGANNQRQIEQLRRECVQGIRPKPLLLIGPIGSAKTSLGRHIIASHCCVNAFHNNGNPCYCCSECDYQGPAEFNGNGLRLRHYEIDCTTLSSRADISEWLNIFSCDDNVACFWDEAHRLEDNDKIEMLLKPVEAFRGIFILAMTDDRAETLNAAMLDRVRIVRLTSPKLSELADFLDLKAKEWQIASSRSSLMQLAKNVGQSFRSCLDVMQRARDINQGMLDKIFIEEQCGPKSTEFFASHR